MSELDPGRTSMVERYRELYELGRSEGLRDADVPSFALINLLIEFAFLTPRSQLRLKPISVRRGNRRRRFDHIG